MRKARSPLQIAKLMLEFEEHILAERLNPEFLMDRPVFLNKLRKVGIEFEDVAELANDLKGCIVMDLANFDGIYFAIDQSELGSYLSPTSIGVIMEFCMDVAPLNETIAPILMMCPREIKSYPKKELLKYQQRIAAERIEKFIEIFPPLHDLRLKVYEKYPRLQEIVLAADEGAAMDVKMEESNLQSQTKKGYFSSFYDMIIGNDDSVIQVEDNEENEESLSEFSISIPDTSKMNPADQELSQIDQLLRLHQLQSLFNLFRIGETDVIYTPQGRILTSTAAGCRNLPHIRSVNVHKLANRITRIEQELKSTGI